MKTQIIIVVEIDIDDIDPRCCKITFNGKTPSCQYFNADYPHHDDYCELFQKGIEYEDVNKYLRCDECLKANIMKVGIKPNPFYQITGKEGQGR